MDLNREAIQQKLLIKVRKTLSTWRGRPLCGANRVVLVCGPHQRDELPLNSPSRFFPLDGCNGGVLAAGLDFPPESVPGHGLGFSGPLAAKVIGFGASSFGQRPWGSGCPRSYRDVPRCFLSSRPRSWIWYFANCHFA